jgi:hypothetical protein
MVLVKILKRRDASSVVVAILVATILLSVVQTIPAKWAGWISGLHNGQYPAYVSSDWKAQYLFPVVYAILQLLVLEVLAWIYIGATGSMKKK